MSGTAIAELNFLPVCSECKRILYGYTVDVIYDPEQIGSKKYDWKPVIAPRPQIYPQHCPFCGAEFASITMPRKLPFKQGERNK